MPTQISVSKHQNIRAENMQVSDAPAAQTAMLSYIDRHIPIVNVVQSILICDQFLKYNSDSYLGEINMDGLALLFSLIIRVLTSDTANY